MTDSPDDLSKAERNALYENIQAVERTLTEDVRDVDDPQYAAGRVDGVQEFAAALAHRLNLDHHE
ncbi:hypothetical protein [Halopelagius fulvigenes]|uniref:Uncharacterized protein n=1 Tax=Halopelagius fulvigenes TaxID=1198324 RepID=A0ABD5TZS3_9EURY